MLTLAAADALGGKKKGYEGFKKKNKGNGRIKDFGHAEVGGGGAK